MTERKIRVLGVILASSVSLALWALLFALSGTAGLIALGTLGVLLGACFYGVGRDNRP